MPGGTFPITIEVLVRKGRRSMRSLQRQIAGVWASAVETDTHLCAGGMHADCEVFAIEVSRALVDLRSLDKDVYEKQHGDAYKVAKRASHRGQVVDGLVLARNSAVHSAALMDPAPDRVVGSYDGDRSHYRVMPTWKPYDELPAEVRDDPGTHERFHLAYRYAVQGTLVMESLLESLAWMLECDPTLAHRDKTGDLTMFPLAGFNAGIYERRHPDWPTVDDYHRDLRDEASRHTPIGKDRVIRHALMDRDGRIEAIGGFCRSTLGYIHTMFTEPPAQVAADIEQGFPYWYTDRRGPSFDTPEDCLQPVTVVDGDLMVDGVALGDLPFADFDDENVWRNEWDLVAKDAELYVMQRKSAG